MTDTARYPSGQPVLLGDPANGYLTFTDAVTNELVDPTTITAVVKGDDGSEHSYSAPTKVSTGTYYFPIPAADTAPPTRYRWVVTATGPGAGVLFGSFTVFDPFTPELISVQDAKAQLEKQGPVDDAELARYLAAVTEVIEDEVGPCSPQTFVEVLTPRRLLQLSHTPVISLTSIEGIYLGTPTYVTTGLDVDPESGMIRQPTYFPWTGTLRITYVAGRTVIPERYRTAALLLLQHLWQSKRADSPAPVFGGPLDGLQVQQGTGVPGYLLPNVVRELLGPTAPAIA